jgi:predicted lipoprotein
MPQHFFASQLNKNFRASVYVSPILLIIFIFITSGCTFATVRSIDEDKESKRGFVANQYIDEIWDGQFSETIHAQAIEFSALMALLDADENAAIAAHGHRSGTGAYSFITSGQARVLEVNTESRIGMMTLDIAPFDGQVDASMAIGPVIRGRDTSLRDAVGFIQYNNFTNQTEFAQISDALKDRVLNTVINEIDLSTIVGKTINFYGTFMWSTRDDIEIVPVSIEVVES